jgi:Flp pilus assembly pilin Flp
MTSIQTANLLEFANLLVIVALPLLAGVIGFLSYLRGHFSHLAKMRESKEREANQNREMYIKMVVQNTIEVEIKEIHTMLAELGKRIDKLFTLLNHDR